MARHLSGYIFRSASPITVDESTIATVVGTYITVADPPSIGTDATKTDELVGDLRNRLIYEDVRVVQGIESER